MKRSEQPLSLRPKKDIVEKIKKIAVINGLSMSDVANMCLASGLNIVETKLDEINQVKNPA